MATDLFAEANKLHLENKFEDAEKTYQMLLEQNHDNPGLLATYGTLMLQTKRYGLALMMLHRAVEKMPNQSDMMANISLCYKYTGQSDKAFDWIKKACQQKNPSAESLANYAGFYTNCGKPDQGIPIAREAVKKNPDLSIAHWNLALMLLEKKQWKEAWVEHEHGLRMHNGLSIMRVDRKIGGLPNWDGTPGLAVAVYGEQGIGDEIMFSSMIPDILKTNPIVLECHTRLKNLFEKSFGVTCYGTREDTEITWPFNHKLDARISIGSLGKFYRNEDKDFPGLPYLKSDSAPRGKKFRLGISWTGGYKASRVKTRSVPLSWWKPILDNDIEIVSLQYTDCKEELDRMRAMGYDISAPEEIFAHDYSETAKIVMSCDLIISVCTSVIHLAGALGVPCWVMTPNKPAWRYGVSGPMPWYKSVRLYRQPPGDSWMPVIHKIAEDFGKLVGQERMVA